MSARAFGLLSAGLLLTSACQRDAEQPPEQPKQQMHSSALALSADGARLFVAHPDADQVSVLNLATRKLLHERQLSAAAPQRDAGARYEPAVQPRALALSSRGERLYVTGQRSGRVYALDAASLEPRADAFACSEPIGVLLSADDAEVYVACAQDDMIVQLSAQDLSRVAQVPCARKPWALAWAADARTLLATHFLGPGISSFETQPLRLRATQPLRDGVYEPDAGMLDVPVAMDNSKQPHGVVRGLYDVIARPGSSELWIAHLMLGIDTPQPELDFQRTVFPALTILDSSGTQLARLSVQAEPGDDHALGDVVSGPHALAFSDDGALAFVVDQNSEDLLVVDAERRIERQLVRPLPGHMPEAVVYGHGRIWVYERNTETIAAFRVEHGDAAVSVTPDGPSFSSLSRDPMPAELRWGQKLFYSANSDDVPTTTNHWVACVSCHLEGRSDAVTWRFEQGPRDTPTNAGGLLDTGFLFRTADRARVQDYWQTIDIEQGGHFSGDEPAQKDALDALADFVNYAIPAPVPPSTDQAHMLDGAALAAVRAQGRAVFERLHCDSCHSGPALTDSGAQNPQLDLSGPVVERAEAGGVLLHDVGTCVDSGPASAMDVAHADIEGHPRAACAFDTPQLRGLWDSAPYLHDGSAATLEDTLPSMLSAAAQASGSAPELTADDRRALVEYLRSL